MDTDKIVFLAVVIIVVGLYLWITVPPMIRLKRDMDQAKIEFDRYMAEYARWMRGE